METTKKSTFKVLFYLKKNAPKKNRKATVMCRIAEQALKNSTTQLKNDRIGLPNYEFGYVHWKTAFDEDKAGYFAIPLREVIQWMEDGTYDVK